MTCYQEVGLMRLDEVEKKALKHALKDFHGEVYIFGSRVDNSRRGFDPIDP
jgi:hypothetical protein